MTIAKNDEWLENDVVYISRIENYQKKISETAPISLEVAAERDDMLALCDEVMTYCTACTAKLESKFGKLKNDINNGQHKDYIKSIEYASIDIKNMDEIDIYDLSITCFEYYKKQRKQFKYPATPKYLKKFLGHIKKVGSYYGSFNKIISCACNAKYKILFSHMEVHLLEPTMTKQSIISWENVIKKFITDHEEYENFKEACLNDDKKKDNLRRVYGVYDRSIQLDSADIHLWKFPDANNTIFYDESLSHMLKKSQSAHKG